MESALPPDAERLRLEAADPATPGDRLRAILALPQGNPWLEPWDQIETAALGNPALPPDLLRQALLTGHIAAWQNPATTLAMLAHPDPDYPDAALRALVKLERLHPGSSVPPPMVVDASALGRRVRWWADEPATTANASIRAFARRLASLLALPWTAGSGP